MKLWNNETLEMKQMWPSHVEPFVNAFCSISVVVVAASVAVILLNFTLNRYPIVYYFKKIKD